jgi:hypothetical protein
MLTSSQYFRFHNPGDINPVEVSHRDSYRCQDRISRGQIHPVSQRELTLMAFQYLKDMKFIQVAFLYFSRS